MVRDLHLQSLRKVEEVGAQRRERLSSHVSGPFHLRRDGHVAVDPLETLCHGFLLLLPGAPAHASVVGRPEEVLVGLVLSQRLDEVVDEGELAHIVVRVVGLLRVAAADPVVSHLGSRTLGCDTVQLHSLLALGSRFAKSGHLCQVGAFAVLRVKTHVAEHEGADLVAKLRSDDVVLFVSDLVVRDPFDFLLAQAFSLVWRVGRPGWIFLQGLVVVEGLGIGASVGESEGRKAVFSQCPGDVTLGRGDGALLIPDELLAAEELPDVDVGEVVRWREGTVSKGYLLTLGVFFPLRVA